MVAFRGVFSNVFKNGRIFFRMKQSFVQTANTLFVETVDYEYFIRKLK